MHTSFRLLLSNLMRHTGYVRLGMCRCGYPFNPNVGYEGKTATRPRHYCTRRCAKSWPARDRRERRKQELLRVRNLAWEQAGQLCLF